jgi:hypothetical protein
MTAAPKDGSLLKLHSRDHPACRARFPWREADARREEVGECTGGRRRGMGPSACARGAGIMSGRAVHQQGSTTTCKDRATKGTPKRAEGGGLAHEPVRATTERQRSPRRSLRSPWLTPGKGALGTRRLRLSQPYPDTDLGYCGLRVGARARADPSGSAAATRRRLRCAPGGKGPGPARSRASRDQNRTREIRPSGIAGRPVRTWSMAELGTHLATERAGLGTLRLRTRASQIYPDNRTSGSVGALGGTPPRATQQS